MTEQLITDWGVEVDPELLVVALTHRSFANEQGGLPDNERLEFLGDSVLSITITDWLFRNYPEQPEGTLSKMRIACVSQTPLAEAARRLHLGEYVLLGVGENKTGGRDKDSILSDTFEALIGATYLSAGLDETRAAVLRALQPVLEQVEARSETTDWKTRLQKHLGTRSNLVEYRHHAEGPENDRSYRADLMVEGEVLGSGEATTKKHAQNLAARAALIALVGPEADPLA